MKYPACARGLLTGARGGSSCNEKTHPHGEATNRVLGENHLGTRPRARPRARARTCVCITPFGFPVDPDVYSTKSGSSAPMTHGSHGPLAAAAAASMSTSRPFVQLQRPRAVHACQAGRHTRGDRVQSARCRRGTIKRERTWSSRPTQKHTRMHVHAHPHTAPRLRAAPPPRCMLAHARARAALYKDRVRGRPPICNEQPQRVVHGRLERDGAATAHASVQGHYCGRAGGGGGGGGGHKFKPKKRPTGKCGGGGNRY